jgi:hypothetical protein
MGGLFSPKTVEFSGAVGEFRRPGLHQSQTCKDLSAMEALSQSSVDAESQSRFIGSVFKIKPLRDSHHDENWN